MDLFIHGVYDAQTLKTLSQLNVKKLGLDLRGKSLNLIPFHTLKSLIPFLDNVEAHLIFENDRPETVKSFLNLLGSDQTKFILQFRDTQEAAYYNSFAHPYSWFFDPDGDWENILRSPLLKTLILPVSFKAEYQSLPKLWHMIQQRLLPVVLHVDSFSDLQLYEHEKNLTLSVDLGREMECSFRKIDQARLSSLSIWRKNHETSAGQ